jgi:hypothetical protein
MAYLGPSPVKIAQGGTSVTSVTTAPTATSFAGWDANKNLTANNFIQSYTTTATAAGTTTLTVASTAQQYFTGATTQTVVMPVTATLVLGQQFTIVNNSTGIVTVQSSGANVIQAMASNTSLTLTVTNTAVTTAAGWDIEYRIQAPLTLPLTVPNGGTGVATLASNGILYGNGVGVVQVTAAANNGVLVTSNAGVPSLLANSGTAGYVLTANTGAPPSWQDITTTGTWTPTVTGATTAGATTYGYQIGFYILIGNLMTVNFTVGGAAATGTGNLRIGGFPTNIANIANYYPVGVINISGPSLSLPGGKTSAVSQAVPNTNYCELLCWGSSTASSYFQMQNTTFGFTGQITYQI